MIHSMHWGGNDWCYLDLTNIAVSLFKKSIVWVIFPNMTQSPKISQEEDSNKFEYRKIKNTYVWKENIKT